MPLFDIECKDCGEVSEFLQVRSDEVMECKKCRSKNVAKIFNNFFQIRTDPDTILRSMPDPTPPLEELRGKVKPGCIGGFEDKPPADPQLKNYTRHKNKYGNFIWEEKKRTHFDMGKKR